MAEHAYIEQWIEDGVGRIALNRPDVLNALSRPMVSEIVHALAELDHKPEVKAILITGNGPSFAAGADIEEMKEDNPVSLELYNQFAVWDQIALIKKPIISAVQGYALGGGFELVLSTDIVFVAENATFGFPEVKIGVMPGAGGTVKLAKQLGKWQSLEWLWTGKHMSARQACAYGLVTRVVPVEALYEEALSFAKRIANMPALSIRLIKDTVIRAQDLSVYDAMQYERKNFYLLFASDDQKEGMQAFAEKRPANFRGR
ncbi:enoyl-CoA hydratase-related protein [Heyndrickxia faecalis]|uniref:enoyl-CoA hydratase/isomerase family protein n=1 Tax=Heyndrickxia TaxID=2837504 RepID=UPI000552DDDB|nr:MULTISPECIES: enoyl-CoA hydratase-related protein [Heyndrickxia]AVD56421.1 enoyl-CoA hydratase [Heyndrickxia coagulans]KGT40158.1 enoyl-CoA hydratase [Heyndrickxia coagulans P38]MED4321782.1 enoyl-CoA hydratase-related protein [Weizmannia sp. CD-2023]MED4838765.1 enoyl-CoA hydratase-related protein [Weizmannia sp. CD-2023]MED4866829.1 enoyl-CoA hydratase-related protein [Weizmannia sp. CD-2023]